jgi:peroxiredoxin
LFPLIELFPLIGGCTFIWMMNDALIVARLCLAAVFFIAGVAKLADRSGTRQALVDFDVPRRLTDPLLLLLPATELMVATALLFPTTARWGAVGSLVLLALFVVGLTRVLRRGEAPDCHCFGQVHSKPASWVTVARNFVLALPAAFVVLAGPGPSLASWVADTDATALWLIATGTLATLTTITSVLLWRENRRLRSTDDRVAAAHRQIGALAPQFSLPSTAGYTVSLQDLLADDRACLLTFVSPGCGPCKTLLPELARWHDTITERLALTLVTAVEATQAEKLAREHALTDVLIDEQSTVSHAYGVTAVPSAVLVASDGTVRSTLVSGPVVIESLIRLALQGEAHRLPPGIAHNTPIRAAGAAT